MIFCPHCIKRTDGVFEIKHKVVSSRKQVLVSVIAFAELLWNVVVLRLIIGRKGGNSGEISIIAPVEISTESIENETQIITDKRLEFFVVQQIFLQKNSPLCRYTQRGR